MDTATRYRKRGLAQRGGLVRCWLVMLSAVGFGATYAGAATFYIEIDYMVGSGGHSHMPNQAEIDAVIQMFACQGHTLIVDVDDPLTHDPVLVSDPNNCSNFFGYSGAPNSFGAIKKNNFDNGSGWHYCIFAHQLQDGSCNNSCSSGRAELPGDDFVVTLGCFDSPGNVGTAFDRAATLAHEFGHNLGLTHCGVQHCPNNDDGDPNWVGPFIPNMPSIMTYQYQLLGVKSGMVCSDLTFDEALFKELNYSHGRMCFFDEHDLDEVRGTTMVSVDWDCDGTLEASVAQDINDHDWCPVNVARSWVYDYDEWATIEGMSSSSSTGGLTNMETVSCITAEEWAVVQEEMAARDHCSQATLATESCIEGMNVYIGAQEGVILGTCWAPFYRVQVAHNIVPENSVFYLQARTYDEEGKTTLSKPGKYFCNTGTAEIR